MTLKIKICGIRSPDMAAAAIDAGADYLGLVFFPPSPRNVSLDEGRRLVEAVADRVPVVAVMVDPDDEALDLIVSKVGPDYLQLHGKESPERLAAIKVRSGLPIVKAIRVAGEADVREAGSYSELADLILFDTAASGSNPLPGGTGQAFDWSLLSGSDVARPFGLSGGLTAANIAEAIAVCDPDLVDVSSGVESAPGTKDEAKIRAFIAAAQNAAAEAEPAQ